MSATISPIASAGVLPANRAESLIQQFQLMCLIEPPNLTHLTARATGMRLKPLSDVTTRTGDTVGTIVRWQGELKAGAYELRVEQMTRPHGEVTRCSVAGLVPSLAEFYTDAVGLLNLGGMTPKTQPGLYNWPNAPVSWAASGASIVLRQSEVTDTSGGMAELSVQSQVDAKR